MRDAVLVRTAPAAVGALQHLLPAMAAGADSRLPFERWSGGRDWWGWLEAEGNEAELEAFTGCAGRAAPRRPFEARLRSCKRKQCRLEPSAFPDRPCYYRHALAARRAVARRGPALDAALLSAYDWAAHAAAGHVVADVGGGEGGFLAALLAAHPSLTGVLLERPAVAAAAAASWRRERPTLLPRMHFEAGDMVREAPAADVYFLRWDAPGAAPGCRVAGRRVTQIVTCPPATPLLPTQQHRARPGRRSGDGAAARTARRRARRRPPPRHPAAGGRRAAKGAAWVGPWCPGPAHAGTDGRQGAHGGGVAGAAGGWRLADAPHHAPLGATQPRGGGGSGNSRVGLRASVPRAEAAVVDALVPCCWRFCWPC